MMRHRFVIYNNFFSLGHTKLEPLSVSWDQKKIVIMQRSSFANGSYININNNDWKLNQKIEIVSLGIKLSLVGVSH